MKDSKVPSNVVDLTSFRQKKKMDEELARGRTPLYSTYLPEKPASEEDFGARMQRIRESLEKINKLMSDLKKNSQEQLH